jgi:hypothetical protein
VRRGDDREPDLEASKVTIFEGGRKMTYKARDKKKMPLELLRESKLRFWRL